MNLSRILVIKLADMGDVLTATPALRALRQTFPQATIDLLLTRHTRAVMEHSRLVNGLIPSDNFRFFSPREALKPGLLKEGLSVLGQVRRRGYDTVVVLHHLTTRAGAMKYATIARVSGARVVAGLDPGGGRGRFLTHAAPDLGFGARHEIDYWLQVVELLGASGDNREMELAVSEADRAWARLILTVSLPAQQPVVVVHPGSGGFSAARRWPAQHFARVADALAEQGAQIILVGTEGDGTGAVKAAMQTPPFDLTGQTTLHQLAALLQQVDLFIGGDSGVTHVAAASGAPVVAVFGPTNAAAWGPIGPTRRVLQAEIPCAPCAYVAHQVGLRFGCEARTCLKLVTPAQVVAVSYQLSAISGQRSAVSGQQSAVSSQQSAVSGQQLAAGYQGLGVGGRGSADILGVRVDAVTFEGTLNLLEAFIAEGGAHQVVTVNPEFIVAAQTDLLFRRIINRAALVFADGTGVVRAAKWLKQPPLPERVAGVDVVEALARLSAQKGYRLYFLGAQPGVAEQTVAILQKRYPGMVIAGCYAGSPRAADEDEIVARLQAARPDMVLVAYGAPRQDKWIARNMYRLPAPVLIGVGGAFDFISGATRRAPPWVQRMGLEWLHRFFHQPWRWRRMWNAVPRFLWLVFLARWRGY
jgi:exopolysaccharide biosynthesis WecB/TagA/CpsF family protein